MIVIPIGRDARGLMPSAFNAVGIEPDYRVLGRDDEPEFRGGVKDLNSRFRP